MQPVDPADNQIPEVISFLSGQRVRVIGDPTSPFYILRTYTEETDTWIAEINHYLKPDEFETVLGEGVELAATSIELA